MKKRFFVWEMLLAFFDGYASNDFFIKKITQSVLEIFISQFNLVKNKVKQDTLWRYIATTYATHVKLKQAKLYTVKSFPIDYTVFIFFIYHMLDCKSTTNKLPSIGTILQQKYPWISFEDPNIGFNNKEADLLWVELNHAKSL